MIPRILLGRHHVTMALLMLALELGIAPIAVGNAAHECLQAILLPIDSHPRQIPNPSFEERMC